MALDFPSSPTVGQLYPASVTPGVAQWRWDGTAWQVVTSQSSATFAQYEYTATAGQTVFSGADVNGNTLAYTSGLVEVYVNGWQLRKADFTATNGTSVTLAAACSLNDLVTIIALAPVAVSLNAPISHGQCKLIKSGANLLLIPWDGNRLIVNGVVCTVPDAGVSLPSTGTVNGTLYNIYATQSGGVVNALEASTTAHATSTTAGNKGVEIKSGDDTRTFVGIAQSAGGSLWYDQADIRYVRSWFNRGPLASSYTLPTDRLSNATGGYVATGDLAHILGFKGEVYNVKIIGLINNNTTGQTSYCGLFINGGYVAGSAGYAAAISGFIPITVAKPHVFATDSIMNYGPALLVTGGTMTLVASGYTQLMADQA